MDAQPSRIPVPDTKDRRLCSACLKEEFVHSEVEKHGEDGVCFYCEQTGRTYSIGRIADFVGPAILELFHRDWSGEGRLVADAIDQSTGMGAAASEDTRLVLAERPEDEPVERENLTFERPFDRDVYYVISKSVDTWDLEEDWFLFE